MALLLHLRSTAHPDKRQGARRHWPDPDALEDFCARWTPVWEVTGDGVFLDLTGSGRLLGEGSDGAVRICRDAVSLLGPLSAGLGDDPLVALLAGRLAAAAAGRLLFVPSGSEPAFLAPFSVAVLAGRFPVEIARLQQFGVRTLGDLQRVPRALLVATFGSGASALADAARGCMACNLRQDRRRRPEHSLVVGAVWRRPLAGTAVESALRRALARRAVLVCAGGPGRWRSWCLCATWAGGETTAVSVSGGGHDAWPAWQVLIEDLWRRLPARRQGLVALELRAGRRGPVTVQEDLFPDPTQERRVALTAVWRQRSSVRLGFASEALLDAWNICWHAPGLGKAGAGKHLPGGLGLNRAASVDASSGDS